MRSLLPWILSALLVAGCESTIMGTTGGGGAMGTGAGGAGGVTATGGGGAGAGVPGACLQPLDCAGEDSVCRVRACVAGLCGWENLPEGTATPGQVPGDCQVRVCDGAGAVKQSNDDGDSLDDHNECTSDLCVSGQPRNDPHLISACGAAGAGVCNGLGSCVACVTSAQCSGGKLCMDNHCVPATCLDHIRNGEETGVDCGGSACGPCGSDLPCLRDRDCRSHLCSETTNLCLAPTCGDGVKNGDESGVDCGGSCPRRCALGEGCRYGDDCIGQVCSGAVCLPSCIDGVKDGAETGLDCGGHACAPCKDGSGCGLGDDCASGVCQSNVCVAATCTNGGKDPGEADVDCGGACAPCTPGEACAKGADCTSKVCAGTLCATPTCSDHVRNAGETGVDCGGPTCGKCSDGQGCLAPADCASGVCSQGLCVEPGCTDGVEDLAETDVDCGGGACSGCGYGLACLSGADCASLECVAGKCTQATCDDHITNGDETDMDCGGTCPPCALGQACIFYADCATVACQDGLCVPPTCSDHVRNGQETGIDCGGTTCAKCPGGQGCLGAADCASGTCTVGLCAASCSDGLRDGDETDVDCGGSCGGCLPGGACELDDDCGSHICAGLMCAAPTCSDGVRNSTESDVDCGGTTCPACGNGLTCKVSTDCLSLGCNGGLCQDVLLISEIRSNGPHTGPVDSSFADDFIEVYNPGNAPILLDTTWQIWHRSAQGSCQGKFLRYQGTGVTIGPHKHLITVGLSYEGPTADAPFLNVIPGNSIADAASIWIEHKGKTVDAICYYYDEITLGRLTDACGVPSPYICEGTPIPNTPHNGTSGPTSSVDVSLERKPGGALGNAQDTGDSATDFHSIMPANPQNLSITATH